MVVLCIKPGLLRGAGEATFLNAMWHGRPVIAADDGSAGEYIEDGVNGFVVPAADVEGLRQRIVELWKDDELCEQIGAAGRRLVEAEYTGRSWRERMMKLGMIVLDGDSNFTGSRYGEQSERQLRSANPQAIAPARDC